METKANNPIVKPGDFIILTKSNNGNRANFMNKPLKVISSSQTGNGNVIAIDPTGGNSVTLFNSHPADFYVIATKENKLTYYGDRLTYLEEEREFILKEIDFLEKYDSEEDFVAEKLDNILSAHANNDSPESRREAISQILKELKRTDFI